MSNNSDQHSHSEATRQLILYWRKVRAVYRYANIVSYHVLGAVVKTLVVLYFLFCLLFLTLRYAVLPHIDHYKPDVERLASQAIGQPVAIGALQADWDGLRPRLALTRMVIKDSSGRDALTLPRVDATLSWLSVVMGKLRLYQLEIDKPDMDVRRDADGKLFVAGIPVPGAQDKQGKGGDWLLSQREIVIRHGTVRWNDNLRGAPELLLSDINLELRSHWQHHEFAVRAIPPSAMAAPFDVRAAFDHPAFAANIADPAAWKGEVYVDLGNTDLAAWNAYIPLPTSIQIQRGHGALRAWLDFDRAKVADFTADISLTDSALRFQDLPVLELDQVSGRIGVREEIDQHGAVAAPAGGTSTFGSHGHSISLTNFSFRTNDGMVLPPTTISETYEAAVDGQPAKTTFHATLLDLQTMATFASRLPFSPEWRQMLQDYSPRGQLRNFTAQWQGSYPAVTSYDVQGQFAGLSMKGQAARPGRAKFGAVPAQAALPMIPGFANMTGGVAMNDHGGQIKLAATDMQVELPGFFADPMVPFEKLNMQADWTFQDKSKIFFKIDSMDLVQNGLAASLSGSYLTALSPAVAQGGAKSTGMADFTGHIDQFELQKIGQYLPAQANEQFREWITNALAGGSVRDVAIRLKGDLKDFPFHTETAAERPKGEFTVAGRIVDGVLNYDRRSNPRDPRLPLWPLLEDIQGTIKFDRTRLTIIGEHAKTHGVALTEVKAVIDDLQPPKNILEIVGTANGPLQEFIGYTIDSPVQQMIGGFTDDTKTGGNARLNLKLSLPLSHMIDSKVQGKLQFAGDDIALWSDLPPLTATSGSLEFNEKGFNLNNIHATFLGGPTTLAGGGPGDAAAIRAEGTLTSDGLRKFAGDGMQHLAQRVSGSARYNVAVNLRKKHADVVVDSNLSGLALDLPAPLHKEASESIPTKFEMLGMAAPDATTVREEIKLAFGSAVNARYEREKTIDRNAAWHMARGGIGVFAPAAQPASGLLLNVNLKTLNVDAWSDLMAGMASQDKTRPAGATAHDSAFSDFVTPQVLAARATELIVFGRKLDNVVVGATLQRDVWQANIDSAQASGYVTYSANGGQGRGVATARLSSLIIPQAIASEVTDLLQGKSATKDLPALDIVAEDFDLLGKRLGHLQLNASNVRSAGANEWRIDKLAVTNPDAQLDATGKWSIRDGQNISNLVYALKLTDAGHMLERLGFPNVLRNGAGQMDGEITWRGVPYTLDSASLSGRVKLDVGKGQFLKGDPGAAKLLGVLSLQSLPRRLTLDFRDVFSTGFAFDGLTMSAVLDKGVLTTSDLKMHGVDATVLMEGSADIVNETQNLHVAVIPKLDAGAASVAYILVNPAIGIGSFLAQLFLREPLSRALTDEMQITGPWKDPKVTKIDHKGDKTDKADKTQSAKTDAPAAQSETGK
ncbi:MAG TPA: YhdP family protein [Burkholderiaceae bacterium]|jgi:uncharacterized protein (TIGR02099 family)